MKTRLFRYWLAMNATALRAGAHALKAFLGVACAHAAVDSVPALNLQQIAAVFLFAFGAGILDWLDANPVPIPAAPDDTEKPSAPKP